VGRYEQSGQTCKCRSITLPDTGSRDCADEENGAVEVTPTQRDRMK